MRYFYVLLCLFFVNKITSQKIKVKKGEVLYNGVAVAKANGEQFKFSYSNLDGSNKINVASSKAIDQEGDEILTVTQEEGSRSKDIPMEFLSITMNRKKAIAELLAKKYDVISEKGIVNLDEFFEQQSEQIAETKNVFDLEEIAGMYDFDITQDHRVYDKNKKVLLGSFKFDEEYWSKIQLYDKDDLYLATFSNYNTTHEITITTYDGYYFETGVTGGIGANILNCVKLFYLAGFKNDLVYGIRNYREKVRSKELEARLPSKNVINQEGYYQNKKGDKIEGKVSIFFETYGIRGVGNGKVESYLLNSNLAKYGDVRYINKRGKKRTKFFSAKKGVSVHVKGNNPMVYGAYAVKGDLLDTKNNELNFDAIRKRNFRFYKILEESDKALLISNHHNDEFYIQDKKQVVAFKPKKLSAKTNWINFTKYANTRCEANDAILNVDFMTKEGLHQCFQFFSENCK